MNEIEENLLDNILDEEIHSEEDDDLYNIAELITGQKNLIFNLL